MAYSFTKSAYEQTEIFVLEISSYQLASTVNFAPDVAVLINITPDHVTWHGDLEQYALAKMKIFERAKTAIYVESDTEAASRCKSLGLNNNIENIIKVHANEEMIQVNIGGINHRIIDCQSLQLMGLHNYTNCCIASAIALIFGLSEAQIAAGLTTFAPLEHRLEPCGEHRGVRFFNDSKATNVDAVLMALKSFGPREAIFLLGGRDKQTPLDELVGACARNLAGVVCYGEAGPRFMEAFGKADVKGADFFCKQAETMRGALSVAIDCAQSGQAIVLSPACASFDEFDCFEQRGDVFKKLVAG